MGVDNESWVLLPRHNISQLFLQPTNHKRVLGNLAKAWYSFQVGSESMPFQDFVAWSILVAFDLEALWNDVVFCVPVSTREHSAMRSPTARRTNGWYGRSFVFGYWWLYGRDDQRGSFLTCNLFRNWRLKFARLAVLPFRCIVWFFFFNNLFGSLRVAAGIRKQPVSHPELRNDLTAALSGCIRPVRVPPSSQYSQDESLIDEPASWRAVRTRHASQEPCRTLD